MSITTAKALDEQWFGQLAPLIQEVGETYIRLEPSPRTLAQKRAAFETSGFKQNVQLFPDAKIADELNTSLVKLERLHASISSREQQAVVRQTYTDAIESMAANIRLVLAACAHNAQAFEHENTSLYGQPDKEIFRAACAWIRSDAETAMRGRTTDRIKKLADKIMTILPANGDDYSILIPDESVFHAVKREHRKQGSYYNLLFDGVSIPEQTYITQEEGDLICEQVLRNIGSAYLIADAQNNIWATSRGDQLLLRPPGYRIGRDEFIGIVCHEIGSHILETTNGERQPLRLLGAGLAGYEKGNEGRAFLREQIVYDSEAAFLNQFAWEYIVLLHLAVCLAIGYGGKPFTFSELFNALRTLYAFWQEKRHPHGADNPAWANKEAWYLTVRIMKGTAGTGGAYMKDIVYLEGNRRCWQLAAKNPEVILQGDLGKIDIANPEHMSVMRRLNII